MQDLVTSQAADGKEFGLMDLLIPIVDNIKLLIFGPLLVGLCAWAYTMSQPVVFECTSWLRLSPSQSIMVRTPQDFQSWQFQIYESALMELTSSDVLDILMESPDAADFLNLRGLSREAAYSQLRQQITSVFDKKAVLLKLSTRALQANSAQTLNQKLVEAFIKFSLPKGNELDSLNSQISLTQSSIKLLETEIKKNENSKADARATSDLMIQLVSKLERLQDLQAQTRGVGSEIFVQRPTKPQSGMRPQQKMTIAVFFLATFSILLIFIFIKPNHI